MNSGIDSNDLWYKKEISGITVLVLKMFVIEFICQIWISIENKFLEASVTFE